MNSQRGLAIFLKRILHAPQNAQTLHSAGGLKSTLKLICFAPGKIRPCVPLTRTYIHRADKCEKSWKKNYGNIRWKAASEVLNVLSGKCFLRVIHNKFHTDYVFIRNLKTKSYLWCLNVRRTCDAFPSLMLRVLSTTILDHWNCCNQFLREQRKVKEKNMLAWKTQMQSCALPDGNWNRYTYIITTVELPYHNCEVGCPVKCIW